ncbi:hypothetical protein OROHE_007545 [Orobanche hederae]
MYNIYDVKRDLYASGDSIRRRGNRSLSQKDSILKSQAGKRNKKRK